MQRQYAFFNGALSHQLEHPHAVLLPDAVRAVGGLILHRGVPPRVVMDHGVGLRQIQSDAAGLEADEKQRHRAAGKALDELVALLTLAGQLDPVQTALFQLDLDQCEHAGELREQQHAPTFFEHFGQQLHQMVQLG